MSAESLAPALALIGIVILVSSLLSGLVERTGISQVAIFLLLGVIVGFVSPDHMKRIAGVFSSVPSAGPGPSLGAR